MITFFGLENFVDYVQPILPHVILIIAALIAPAIGMKTGKGAAGFMIAAGFFAMFVTGYMMWDGYTGTFGVMNTPVDGLSGLYAFNNFTGLMILLFLIVFCLVSLMSVRGGEIKRHRGEYFSILAIATVGMMFVVAAEELISLFVALELTGIMSFALVASKKNDPRSSEAAVKYLIMSGLSTALFLYGMSLVYGFTGTMNINEIVYFLATSNVTWAYMVAFITLFAGIAFKVGIIPFHSWVPDVYDGAPTPVSAFLAVGSKKMGFVILLKVFFLLFIVTNAISISTGAPERLMEIKWLFAALAAGTMTIGNIIALTQTSVKRMLAYSSIAQGGYLMIVLAVGTDYALMGGLLHMITHVFMKGGAFIVVAALIAKGVGDKISDYRGLSKRAPLVAFSMMIFMFALAGIPLTGGFVSKFVLFSSALEDPTWLWLAAAAVINSAVSLYYYARVVKAMYVDKPVTTERLRIHAGFKAALAICVVAILIIGIWPGPVIEFCESGADTYLTLFRDWLHVWHP